MPVSSAEPIDRDKTVELLRALATDLNTLASTIQISLDPDNDNNVRNLWDEVAETMNSVFSVMATDEQFEANMEQLIQKAMSDDPTLSREEAEKAVLNDMDGGEDDETENEDDDEGLEAGDELEDE